MPCPVEDEDSETGDVSAGDAIDFDGDSDGGIWRTFSEEDVDLFEWQYRFSRGGFATLSLSEYERCGSLKSNEFRLLWIEPAQTASDPISVKLITRTLEALGTFYALSYT